MTDEEQRIAIAEVCGKLNDYTRQALEYFKGRDAYPDAILQLARVPDYPNDLNGMHEAEMGLSDEQYRHYDYELTRIRNHDCEHPGVCRCKSATARQRSEAFLKTKGIWK